MKVFAQALRKAQATVTAVVTAGALMVAGQGVAEAANRDWLRADATGTCEWDQVGNWVQRCDVWSPANNRTITVQIQPAQRGGNAGLYLLDGARASERASAWTTSANAPATYAPHNITLVMPVGGAGSFYMDWLGPAFYNGQGYHFKWETFLTQELPVYLEQNFGVARNNNAIAGLSMGGTAALNLAARHPNQFRQTLSWSGYPSMTLPGMHSLLRLALVELGGFNINAMYGFFFSPERFSNDPLWNMSGLRNTDIYISAATGFWSGYDGPGIKFGDRIVGSVLEGVSLYSTSVWEVKARAEGLRVTVDYPPAGIHSWEQWISQLEKTKPRILDYMNAW
ncbi:esterase family protein [Corynebacterium sp. ES2794-CONJ1]|uniref:alpha/beta hydrolase n=1 Tax=unclassified Corynebacterium TaxID=2624378 RepID=UPI002168BF4F|nr:MULTISPECIES: alpha/beta hydrolase family protein [unclassified Corynebacterium]MCS4490132.1 esterase family protein [Corynebacterium sp. ES2775-CONJ]MCS4492059.1 esterase family protein [Corynebacterium sp. ES2715-CONJ3]MCS4532167.1 esterase family protein [Corynebacterium sp. ES2730-CONJ]MCU9519563.1 esterase family protein [Corynebacterium sp. ES2794-CONJ1]